MDQENEEVKYSYTGDVSSLKKATEDALGLLGKIESKFQELSSANSFGTNKRAAKSFDSNLQKVLKTAQQVQSKLESLSKTKFDISYGKNKQGTLETDAPKIRSMNAEALSYQQTLQSLSDTFDNVSNKSSLTTKEVKTLTEAVKQSAASLNESGSRLDTAVAKEEKFEQTLQKVAAVSFTVGDRVKSAMDGIKQAAKIATVPVAAMRGVFQSLQDKAETALNRTTRLLQAAGVGFRQFKGDAEEAADAEEEIADAFERTKGRFKNSASSINKTQKKIEAGFRSVANAARSIFINVGSDLSKPFAKMLKLTTKIRKAFERIFLYRIIRSSLQKIEKAFATGIENLYQYSKLFGKDFADSMDSLASSVLYLKNSFGAMAAPLINAVAPIVDTLIDKFVTLINVVGKFFAVLTGKGKFLQAKKATTEFGEAAEKASGAVKDFTMSWDELNIISESSSGSAKDVPDYSSMFEEVDIDEDQFDWTKRLKEAIERGDWDGVGRLLADKFNSIFKSIDWAGIGAKLGAGINNIIHGLYSFLNRADWQDLGQSLATMVNNLIENVDWETAGRLWVRKWTALMDLLLGFFNNLNWDNIAQAIVDFVNGAIDEASTWLADNASEFLKLAENIGGAITKAVRGIKWADLGQLISDSIGLALQTAITLMETIDWQAVGNAMHDFLFETDWTPVVEGIAEGIGAVIGGLAALIWGLIKPEWEKAITWWQEHAFVDGKLSIESLFNGIRQWFIDHDPVVWLNNHVVQPVLNGIKKGFGLELGETETQKIGGLVSQGLLNGMEAGLPPLHVIGIFRRVIDLANQVFQIGSPSKVFEEIGGYMLQGLLNGMNSMGSSIRAWGAGLLSQIKDALGIHSPSRKMEEVGDYMVEGLFNGLDNIKQYLVKLIKNVLEYISKNLGEAIKDAQGQLEKFMEWFNQSLTELLDKTQSQTRLLTTGMTGMYQSMANSSVASINRIIAALNSIPRNITTTHTIVQQTVGGGGSGSLATTSSSSSYVSSPSNSAGKITAGVAKVVSGIGSIFKGAFHFASGGVVNSPTYSLIGEAGYPEAVVPLGSSPQLDEMLDRFAEKVQSTNSSRPVEVKVYIGDKEWDAFTYKSAQRGEKLVGASPITVGG